MQCETRPAAESNHADPQQKRRGPRDASGQRNGLRRCAPTRDRAPDAEVKDRHVDTSQAQADELGLEVGALDMAAVTSLYEQWTGVQVRKKGSGREPGAGG